DSFLFQVGIHLLYLGFLNVDFFFARPVHTLGLSAIGLNRGVRPKHATTALKSRRLYIYTHIYFPFFSKFRASRICSVNYHWDSTFFSIKRFAFVAGNLPVLLKLDLTPTLCCDSSPCPGVKRGASFEALGTAEMKKSRVVENDASPSSSVIYSLTQRLGFLSSKVEKNPGIKEAAKNIFIHLKFAVEDDERYAETCATLVVNLIKDKTFQQAFVEAHLEDPSLISLVDAYSLDVTNQVRVEFLRRDNALQFILQKTLDRYDMRDILGIAMGYWSSQWFCTELHEEINKNEAARKVYRVTRIVNIDVPYSIEGLKSALATRFKDDELQNMYEQINKSHFKFGGVKSSSIKWLVLLWESDKDFRPFTYGYYEHPFPGFCNA
ncbi:methionyl-tRNA formyltransferase, partial [Striga asiatica]